MGGVGAGFNMTCAIAIITNRFPDEREKNLGFLDGATGLGLLIGPLLGSSLYTLGGYCMPFWIVGCAGILLFVFLRGAAKATKMEGRPENANTGLSEDFEDAN